MTKRIMVDPPSGWRYGWPKECPRELVDASDEEFKEWVLDKGYPNHLVEQGMLKHCRFWVEDDENS